jgi:hypothetical protein
MNNRGNFPPVGGKLLYFTSGNALWFGGAPTGASVPTAHRRPSASVLEQLNGADV